MVNRQIYGETAKKKKREWGECLSEPVEGISPFSGTRSFALSQGGDFCSPTLGLFFLFCWL